MSKKSLRCKKTLKEILGDKVSQETIDKMVDDLEKLSERAGSVSSESFAQLSKKARDELRRAIKERQKMKASNLAKTAARMNRVKDFIGAERGERRGILAAEALISFQSHVNIQRRGSGLSAERRGKALERQYQDMLIQGLHDIDAVDLAESGTIDREIMQELFEIRRDGNPGISGNKKAQEIAGVINSVQNKMIDDLNAAGLPMKRYEGYIIGATHNPELMVGRDADPKKAKSMWVEEMLPKINHERTFGAGATQDEKISFLSAAYDNLVSGGGGRADSLKGVSDELITVAGYKNSAKNLLQHKVLHFKDGNSFFEYNQMYGKKTLWSSLTSTIHQRAKLAGAIEILGTDPEGAVAADIARVKKLLGDDIEAQKAFDKRTKRIKHEILPQVLGFDYESVNELWAKRMAGVRALNNFTLLGKAGVWSVTDLATAAAEVSRVTGKSMNESFSGVLSDFINQIPPSRRKEVTKMMGVYLDDAIAMNYVRLGMVDVDDFAPGLFKKIQQVGFTISGLNFVTNASRNATAMSISRIYAKDANVKFDDLEVSLKKSLEEFGITPDEWDELRVSIGEDASGNLILPEAVANERTRSKFQDLLSAAAEFGSPEPSARSKSRLLMGTSPGTKLGETLRSIAQFKSFPIFMYDIMMRQANAGSNRDILKFTDLFRGGANYRAMAQLMVGTTLMAIAADSLLSVANNEKPKDLTDPKTWLDAFVRGGTAGLYGDLLLNDPRKYGRSEVESLAGPTIGKGQDLVHIFKDTLSGKDTKREMFDFAVKNTLPNTFYLKTGMDKLVLDSMRDALEPGYAAKKARRQMKKNRDKLF